MKGIVVIPIWRRPELLALTLESLLAARGAKDQSYYFALDDGADPDNVKVITRMMASYDHTCTARVRRYAATDTFNTMMAYYEAATLLAPRVHADLIYMMQEDVLVTRDFFEFHEKAHAGWTRPTDDAVFGVSACPFPKWLPWASPDLKPDSPEIIGFTPRYHPWAVSLRVNTVIRCILPHAKEEYWRDQLAYVARSFPYSKIGHGHGEQDYLIDNVMNVRNRHVIVPRKPRGFHAGWWSDRRESWHPRDADLDKRIEECRAILANPARLRQLMDYVDVAPVPLEGYNVEHLHQ